MALPAGMSVSWDRTLEQREVALRMTVREPQQWQPLLCAVRSERVERGLRTLLAEL